MSLSRSPITVTMAALASSGLAASAVATQRCDSLSDKSRRSCETVAAALAGPHLAAQQTEAAAVLGVHRQHRVQQNPAAVAMADLPEPAPAFCSGREVDFAGVLDRQYMAA